MTVPRIRGRASVAPEIFERHPDYRASVVYATGLSDGPSGGASLARLEAVERAARQRFADVPVAEHPHIAAWRAAYTAFGARGNRFPCSAEALLRRAVKDGLPRISRLVDLYNAISVAYVIPAGGEDWDRAVGDLGLRFARGDEPFETREGGEPVTVSPEPGEVVWCDGAGVTCRRWNWRQCTRTALTDGVASAYFVLDALGPCPDAELRAATDDLVAGLRVVSPGCSVEVALLAAGAGIHRVRSGGPDV